MPPRGSDVAGVGAVRAQQGQVLVLGMLLVAVLGLAWLRYFATGQTVAAKTRLLHGLDAATYSGALVQARTLNLLSYLNRAQLAHQLAMAHLLTLGSWAHFGGTQAGRLAQGNPPAYLIGMLFGAGQGRAYLSAAAAVGLQAQVRTQGPLGQAFAAHESFVHDYARELSAALVRELPQTRLAAMQAVLAAHYPERAADTLRPVVSSDGWPALLQRHAPDAALFALVRKVAAPYAFLGPRDSTARNPWSVSPRCPSLRHELRRRGATALDASGRWQAGDTVSYHALRSNPWIGCYYREYAMGWAWMPAQAGQEISPDYSPDAPADFSAQDFWRWVQASTSWDLLGGQSNPLANSYAMFEQFSWPSRGLAAYFDVAPGQGAQAAAGFVAELTLDMPEGPSLHARSAAETLFSRPERRADGQREAANLFHPYWQARLAAPLARLPGD
ncbi:hypothetical protein [Castellaniella caeni]|uniref:hypothetical protein n=1 Tax=Castellaniella caeni TaxID=266123 RepID=UPI00082B4FDB|nr:hypothetical protein [Castellaniella caeni]